MPETIKSVDEIWRDHGKGLSTIDAEKLVGRWQAWKGGVMVDDLVLRDVHRRGLMLLDGMMRDNLIVNSDLSASANKFGEYVQMWDQYFEKIKGAKEKPSPEQARKYLQETDK